MDKHDWIAADEFLHILSARWPGTPDAEIPLVCRNERIDCLVSANVRDFGARKFYFQALLAEGLDVAVMPIPGGLRYVPFLLSDIC